MSIPPLKVELGLEAISSNVTFFTLDDATRGVLDGATYKLGGTVYFDVTSQVKSVSTSRGRSRELDKFTTGTAQIVFKNQDRAFDPSNTASLYYPSIVPRREIRITSGNVTQYVGLVDDWNLSYDVGGLSDAQATCVDAFAQLAKQTLNTFVATSQKTGTRIAAILAKSEVAWPVTLEAIDTGQQTLQADTVTQDVDVLSYLQLVEQSEPGSLFISKGGFVTFKDRNTANTVAAVTFADDGSGIAFTNVQVVYGTEMLYNRVTLTRLGGTVQTASDATSIAEYGIAALDEQGLLMVNDTDTGYIASYLVGRYANPELRFEEVTVEMSGLSVADQNLVLGLELSNVVTVKFTPNAVGAQISSKCMIIGIAHDIRIDSHKVTIRLAQTDGKVAFVLNDTTFGVLDVNTLGI